MPAVVRSVSACGASSLGFFVSLRPAMNLTATIGTTKPTLSDRFAKG